MAEPIRLEEVFVSTQSVEALWPILRKTDWVNRAVGLPPVDYEIIPRPEGGTTVIARARLYNIALKWIEHPFEWVENKFYTVRREFDKGPIAEGEMGLRFAPGPDGGTRVTAFCHLTPRTRLGHWIAKFILGPKVQKDMARVVQHAGEFLQHRTPVSLPNLPVGKSDAKTLQQGVQKLAACGQPGDLVGRLRKMLDESPDVELVHMRPFTLARDWKANRWEVLSLFLHATRAGLLNLGWEVLCPNCRSTRRPPAAGLGELEITSHCDVCNIQFDGEFDKSVELKFAASPGVRAVEDQTYCLAGPGGKPHIVSQLNLDAGQRRNWDLPELSRSVRLRSPQIKHAVLLAAEAGPQPIFDAVIVCHPDAFEVKFEYGKTRSYAVQIFNPCKFPVQIILETPDWDDEILTAARVTNWQEFRDLFDLEVISPDEQVTVGSQVLLFTDLKGSTAMYNRIGDGKAYGLVRDHFVVLREAVLRQHGAFVKTIGDAVMAVFSRLDEALAAVAEMHAGIGRVNPDPSLSAKLQLKSAIHAGPCLAVNANERLDFFGTTVNLAARLVERSQGDDLILSAELRNRPETIKFIEDNRLKVTEGKTDMRGFEGAQTYWRLSFDFGPVGSKA